MPDPSYVIENHGREAGLQFHLDSAFYPPLPGYVKAAFIDVFKEYWEGELDASELNDALADRAYYVGGIDKYNFWQFLNEEDLH